MTKKHNFYIPPFNDVFEWHAASALLAGSNEIVIHNGGVIEWED